VTACVLCYAVLCCTMLVRNLPEIPADTQHWALACSAAYIVVVKGTVKSGRPGMAAVVVLGSLWHHTVTVTWFRVYLNATVGASVAHGVPGSYYASE
jgi:hypothetical protein